MSKTKIKRLLSAFLFIFSTGCFIFFYLALFINVGFSLYNLCFIFYLKKVLLYLLPSFLVILFSSILLKYKKNFFLFLIIIFILLAILPYLFFEIIKNEQKDKIDQCMKKCEDVLCEARCIPFDL